MSATIGASVGVFETHGEDILRVQDATGKVLYRIDGTGTPVVQDGQALAAQGTPAIVAAVSLATVGFAVFNTAAAVNLLPAGAPAGLYRASLYMVATTTFVTNTEETITFGWTDDDQAQTKVFTTGALTAGTILSGDVYLHSTGVAAVTYTPNVTGSPATVGAAALYIRLERI